MNGPQEIRNINTARSLQAVAELRDKAQKAEQQGNPLAADLKDKYEALAKELGVEVQ